MKRSPKQPPKKSSGLPWTPVLGLQPFQGRKIAYGLGVSPALNRPVAGLMASLYKLFEENDCSLVEINPLGITADGRALAMDAKINIDDDAIVPSEARSRAARHRTGRPARGGGGQVWT